MTHPLTDEICYGMKVEYSSAESMRAAADWQLEQCVEELDCLLHIFGATCLLYTSDAADE